MDHAAAHEELADLALEPHRLRRLADDTSPGAAALRAHLAGCADCRAELDAWRRVYAGLDMASADAATSLRSLEPSEPPGPSRTLRERTLAAVRVAEEQVPAASAASGAAAGRDPSSRVGSVPSEDAGAVALLAGTPRPPRRFGGLGRFGWLAAAAALIVAVGLGALLVQRTGEADQARLEAGELAAATATLDRILAEPTHWVVTLHTADGAAGGTLAWSASDVVVLTSALTPAMPGTTYRCWIERDGTRTPVGTMSFSEGVGYWAGSATSWGALQKGSRFGVTAIAGSDAGGPAVLVADL